jgi:hypothetical protein
MSAKTDELRDLYLDVVGEETITEPRERGPSRDPIGSRETEIERDVSDLLHRDGLDEAVENPAGES